MCVCLCVYERGIKGERRERERDRGEKEKEWEGKIEGSSISSTGYM